MLPLYSVEEFNIAKSQDKLPYKCYNCKATFYRTKHVTQRALNPKNVTQNKFCSVQCHGKYKQNRKELKCTNCSVNYFLIESEYKRTSQKNHFCTKSCAATYNNKHKMHGTKRSKLEKWIEEQLNIVYPHISIEYNKKDAINSELDIYIPSLNIAFELNGIFHYEPIYGLNKLEKIKLNDISKTKECHDRKIDLCIIDTSLLTYFKPVYAKKFLDIICNIINERLLTI